MISRLGLLCFLLLTASQTTAFIYPGFLPRKILFTSNFAYRQNYQYQLDQLTGKVNLNGDSSYDVDTADAQMALDLKSAEDATAAAVERFTELERLVRVKEQQQREMAIKMKQELEKQKVEFKNKVNEMGSEFTYLKLDAHKEKLQTIQLYKERENSLKEDMESLSKQLLEEKQRVFESQQATNRILESRSELKAAVGNLQKQLESERKEWEQKFVEEKEAHELEMKRLVQDQLVRSQEMMNYAAINRDLEDKLASEQEEHARYLIQYEQTIADLEGKLNAEKDAHNRDVKSLLEEQAAFNRDLLRYEKLSQDLASKLNEEQEAHSRDVLVLSSEQEARKREIDKTAQELAAAKEITESILQKRAALEEKSAQLQEMLQKEKESHDQDLKESQKLLSRLENEISEMEKEKDFLLMNKEQSNTLYVKLSQAEEKNNRILQKRVEIEAELANLQRKYEMDSTAWRSKMEREVAAQRKIAEDALRELAKIKEKEAGRVAERNDLGSLIGRTFKVMLGMPEE